MSWKFDCKSDGLKIEYLNDIFFNSLRNDYVEFDDWYKKSVNDKNKSSYYWLKDNMLEAFTAFKIENETIGELPKNKRLKITTIKSNDNLPRFSEMVFYKAFRKAMSENITEVYFTIINNKNNKEKLTEIAIDFGFVRIGKTDRKNADEIILLKNLNRATDQWKSSYPKFIKKDNRLARIMIINDKFHDNYLQDAELSKINQHTFDFSKMGIKKAYIHNQRQLTKLILGDIIFTYRRWSGFNKGYKSVVTGLGEVIAHKIKGKDYKNFLEFKSIVKNIHALDEEDLLKWYKNNSYITIFAWIWPFGAGKNINWHFLKRIGVEGYLSDKPLNDKQIKQILKKGRGKHE